MPRPRRTIVPLDAEAVSTRTEAEIVPVIDASASVAQPEPDIPPEPQRSPERQRLADSIAALAAVNAEIAEAAAAIEPAYAATFAAQRALDAAETALKDARPLETYVTPPRSAFSHWGSAAEDEARERAARAAAAAPPISVADAKAAVEAAKDAVDTAQRTRQWHEDRHKMAGQSLTLKQIYVRDAVRDVLRSEPATLALAQRCRRLTTQASAARAAFAQVIGGDTIQYGSPFHGWDMPADADSGPEAMKDWSVSRDWRAAIDALRTDPDAVLPMPA